MCNESHHTPLSPENKASERNESFSEAWSGLDSGVGAREEPSLNQAWGDAAKGEEFSSADEA